jgi:predicted nucleic acid-binding protein
MKLILDTNCYISYLNRRNEKQHHIISTLLDSITKSEHEVYFTGHNMTEIVSVLQSIYKAEPLKIHEILTDLLETPGFEFIPGHYAEEILKIWPNKVKDYGDAVIASSAYVLNAKVVTFDQAFSRSLEKLGLRANVI